MKRHKLAVGVFVLWCFLAVVLAKTSEPSSPSFEPPEVVSSAEPVYPMMAMGPGTVVLAVSISADGDIQDVKVIHDSKAFHASALAAIKGWKFKPATLDGKPVPSVVPVAFSFSWPVACMRAGR
jgi:protein TonB